jgi:hypothetical protein
LKLLTFKGNGAREEERKRERERNLSLSELQEKSSTFMLCTFVPFR